MMTIPTKFSKIATICTTKEGTIGAETALTVDGHALHEGLKIGRDFSNWAKGRIKQLGLVEGVDFERVRTYSKMAENTDSPKRANQVFGGDRRSIDYIFTLDAAKHIAMVEKNEQGHLIRSYFIWVEKQARAGAQPLTAQVTGGIIKSVSRSVFREEFAPVLDEIRYLIATHQTGTAVVEAKSAKEWCEEYGCLQKGRRSVSTRIGNALSALARQNGTVCSRCARTGTWLYPESVARPFMEGQGRHWIRLHNALIQDNQPPLVIHPASKRQKETA